MPPTSRSTYFHSLRVHHQVSTWHFLKTVLDKEEYGFHVDVDKHTATPIASELGNVIYSKYMEKNNK